MSAELQGNEHLARYETLEDLARGHVETVGWARGRIPVPKADDPVAMQDFIGKMRPASADDYVITMPEGAPENYAGGFRAKAHELGLTDWQAKGLVDWNNGFASEEQSRAMQKGMDGMKALELELGPVAYNRRLEATANMLDQIEGLDGEAMIAGMERAGGNAEATLRGLFALAERTGELDKVDPDDVSRRMGSMTPESAKAKINERMNDKAFMEKVKDKTSREYAEWTDLNRLSSGGARRR